MTVTCNFETKTVFRDYALLQFLKGMIGHGIVAPYSIVNSEADNNRTFILQYDSSMDIQNELDTLRCLCIAFDQTAIAAVITEHYDTFLQCMIGQHGSDVREYTPFNMDYFTDMADIDA